MPMYVRSKAGIEVLKSIRFSIEVGMKVVYAECGRISRRQMVKKANELGAVPLSWTIERPSKRQMARGVPAKRIVVYIKTYVGR